MPTYTITRGINPFGDELVWQVRDSDGYLVFVTDLKSEAEAWLDGQEQCDASRSSTSLRPV